MNKAERKDFLFKEIDLIQKTIDRISKNSFMLKGWTITLVIGTFIFKGTKNHAFLAFVPIVLFWYLDAYFLWLERKYRHLHKWLIENRLLTDAYLLDMDTSRFNNKIHGKFRTMYSFSLLWFYGLTLLFTLLILYITMCK